LSLKEKKTTLTPTNLGIGGFQDGTQEVGGLRGKQVDQVKNKKGNMIVRAGTARPKKKGEGNRVLHERGWKKG